MKRLLILFFVLLTAVLVQSKRLEKQPVLTQQQKIDELKKEIKELKKIINQTTAIARE